MCCDSLFPSPLYLMNRRRGTFVALSLCATLICGNPCACGETESSPASSAGGDSITVAFWNIQWFPGRRPKATQREEINQVEAVHREIVNLKADIIGMEEVRDFHRAELAVKPLAGFKVDVCSDFPPREGQIETQQAAIASRLQPVSAWSEMWKPHGAMVPPRGFAFAAYQVAPDQMLLVYALHLKSNRGEAQENISMREESIHQLLSHMKAMAERLQTTRNVELDHRRRFQHRTRRQAFRYRKNHVGTFLQWFELVMERCARQSANYGPSRGAISGGMF